FCVALVADATWKINRAQRGLKPTAKFRRRYAARRCEPLSLPPLKLRHSHIEDAPRHCVGARLKFHGDALFAARQLFWQRVLEIEKLARMNFERLRGDLFAVHQKVKGTRTPFAAAIGADQRHRLVRRRFQIETEPAVPRGAPPLTLEVAV